MAGHPIGRYTCAVAMRSGHLLTRRVHPAWIVAGTGFLVLLLAAGSYDIALLVAGSLSAGAAVPVLAAGRERRPEAAAAVG
jgi:hypothetical protein